MPSHCAVAICKSPKGASYFCFPSDPKLCQRWISACKRKGKFNPKTSRICDKHFLESDFIRDLKNELLNGRLRKKLTPGAIPSIHLLPDKNVNPVKTARCKRAAKREQKEIVETLLLQGKVHFFKKDCCKQIQKTC